MTSVLLPASGPGVLCFFVGLHVQQSQIQKLIHASGKGISDGSMTVFAVWVQLKKLVRHK